MEKFELRLGLPTLASNSKSTGMRIELKIGGKMCLQASFPKSLDSTHLDHGQDGCDYFYR